MLEGSKEHNISQTQLNPMIKYKDIVNQVYAFSFSFSHPRYFLHNFAIYIANL